MKSPTERFSNRVEQYAQYRPRYPSALVDLLLDRIPLPATVADIGSGTGILTGPCLRLKAVPELVYLSSPKICAEEREIREDISRELTRNTQITTSFVFIREIRG